jgi:diketogulonate reductase-like aldo/keto reductase
MRTVTLPTGEVVPALGQGTWQMAEAAAQRQTEIAALQLGMELGLTLVDTAEMYGEGAAEELVGEAIAGQRENVFLVSKVYPHNASRGRSLRSTVPLPTRSRSPGFCKGPA